MTRLERPVPGDKSRVPSTARRHQAHCAGTSIGTAIRVAVEQQCGTDSNAELDEERVVEVLRNADPLLGQQRQDHFALDVHPASEQFRQPGT